MSFRMWYNNNLKGVAKILSWSVLLGAVSALGATYSATVDSESDIYYKVTSTSGGGSQSQSCNSVSDGISISANNIANRTITFYSDNSCNTQLVTIAGDELFASGTSVAITVQSDGSWEYVSEESSGSSSGSGSSGSSTTSGSKKTLAFFTPWSNTNAILYVNGDSVAVMTSLKNYCGWFVATVTAPSSDFNVYFKQTIGTNYVSAEGLVSEEPTIAAEISLDSVAALTDTIWVQGYKSDVPALFSKYPGVLGDCPLKKLPVTVFDWLHGDGSDTQNRENQAGTVSQDFGTGGCSNLTTGMVQYNLGENGVPVPSDPFPSSCKYTTHLAYWFLPEVVETKDGVEYTNMTCRDIYISMDDEGFWLAEVSDKAISEGNEANSDGMFLVDDFRYLDDEETIENPYYDSLKGSSGYHNFGFAVKIQAQFEYVPGQYFDFYGDDDVWVFIDNRLAVDIGGQHAKEYGAVLLDTIGQNTGDMLVAGETYDFHIFYVERHTSASNFRMHTSIDLQTDASIFLTSDKNGDVTNYDIWQINKKSGFSCGYTTGSTTEVDTTGGASTFRLTGGNLDSPEILDVGTHYEGIIITSDSTFSIDSAKIVDNATLSPGHYFLEITLKSDASQTLKVEIIIPSYAIPSVAFADVQWKILGTEVDGDTLQIGQWAYATYQVNITFYEDWAQVTNYNKKINLSISDPNVDILDTIGGRSITYVNLDSEGKATFYVHANAEVVGAILTAKGTVASASMWTNLNFMEPPIPYVTDAIISDRNGDGRADSLYVSFDKSIADESVLDSIQFTFGESFATTSKFEVLSSGTELVITAESMDRTCTTDNCGFGSRQFTGGETDIYDGNLNAWFTYKKDGETTAFYTENIPVTDGVGPILLKAVKTKLDDGNRELAITMSEAITDDSRIEYAKAFELICMRSGIQETPENPVQQSGSGTSFILIYSPATEKAVLPDNGDQIRFAFEDVKTMDLSGNKPHENNPWVVITGDQEISNESPGVITYGSDPYGIISSDETTQSILITNTSQDVQEIGDSLGVQGHLIDYDISTIMIEETQNSINALDAFIETRLGSTTTYDTTITGITEDEALQELFNDIAAGMVGEAYGFTEEVIAGITDGSITVDNYKSYLSTDEIAMVNTLVQESVEASRDTVINVNTVSSVTQEDIFEAIRNGELDAELLAAGISASLIEAIKDGTLTEYNIDEYRNGSKSLVSDTAVVLYYQTRYYSQFGEYVGGDSKTIKCSDESVYGTGGCQANSGRLFLAWNMRSSKGRLVGTGVYIARLQIKIKVNGKTTVDQTRDKLMGVRRGKINNLNIEF